VSDDWNLQVSVKFGQTQAGMLNVRGENAVELNAHIVSISDGEILTNITTLESLLQAGSNLVPVTSPAAPDPLPPALQPSAGLPQQRQQPQYQQTPAPTCPHGTRQFKSGVGAKGPWAAYFCPQPKGTPGACAPEWTKA
jgi:hypothetical protein